MENKFDQKPTDSYDEYYRYLIELLTRYRVDGQWCWSGRKVAGGWTPLLATEQALATVGLGRTRKAMRKVMESKIVSAISLSA